MKIAIVHDWLVTYAGAERVLEQMVGIYPEADIFSIVDFIPESERGFIKGKKVNTSFIQNLPLSKSKYRHYLPLMPFAVEQFDLSNYDLVISSSHAIAKGVITGPDQLHLCMCYSPIRYAWDLQHQYLKEANLENGLKGLVARKILHDIRKWDYRTSNGVDGFIAISQFIARRIWKIYRRESVVIYPPVNVEMFLLNETKEKFYLTASRMVPYKRIDLIVEAFSDMPDKELVVIGDGPDFNKIRTKVGKNVRLMGYQPTNVLIEYMQRAKAFVFAAEEDFGIAPIEAQACGTPVIAFGKGGVLETINGLDKPIPTGVFFYEQKLDSLKKAIQKFELEARNIKPKACRQNSLRFSTERFRKDMKEHVEQQLGALKIDSNKRGYNGGKI